MHPVVRAIAFSGLRDQDRDHLGQQIVDHFSQRPHNPYEQAETLEDLRDAITVVRTLTQLGRNEEAWDALRGDLIRALQINVEAYPESLSLLRPFFQERWSTPAEGLTEYNFSGIAAETAIALSGLGEHRQAAELDQMALSMNIAVQDWGAVMPCLTNLSADLYRLNRLALSERYSMLALRLAEALDNPADLFRTRLEQFTVLAEFGRPDEAEAMWYLLDAMGRDWPRNTYRPGDAEQYRIEFMLFPQGNLTEEEVAAAELLARAGQNRGVIRNLHRLRGDWRLARGEYALAVESFQEAIRMVHEAGFPDRQSETPLALARFRLKITELREPAQPEA